MKKIINLLFNPNKTGLFWLYIVFGILGIAVGIMLMPIWSYFPIVDLGIQIVNLIVCTCILLYLFCYLLPKMTKNNTEVIQTLMIVEFVVMFLIAISCILQQFRVIYIGGACAILGIAIWCRSVVEIFKAYFHQHGDGMYYPLWYLIFIILLLSFGVLIFVRPLFTDIELLWFFIGLIFIFSLILIIDGFLSKPVNNRIKK